MIEFWDTESFNPSSVSTEIRRSYKEVLPYVRDFLSAPHPYRNGRVCPYAHLALKSNHVFFTSYPEEGNSLREYKKHIEKSADFLEGKLLEASTLGAVIILFPENYSISTLLEIHAQNKAMCVHRGLMLGAMYRTNQSCSLHSSEFYPLRTPAPILVIRNMVLSDVHLLDRKHHSWKDREKFLASFLEKFDNIESSKKVSAETVIAKKKYEKYKRRRKVTRVTFSISLVLFLFFISIIAI